MAHVYTIVKVRATSSEEAVDLVKELVENDNHYSEYGTAIFDWYGESKISEEVTTEEDFQRLRSREVQAGDNHLKESYLQKDDEMRGYYLRLAGESFDPTYFWSDTRFAFDLAADNDVVDQPDEGQIYYVETDRHY